jgi:hypothetical protein
LIVKPGPVPGIHVFGPGGTKNVDGRDKPGREIQQVTLLLELRRAIR